MKKFLAVLAAAVLSACANIDDARKFYARACEFYASGDFESALDALELCARADASFERGKFLRAKILFFQDEIPQAERDFAKLARKNPDWTDARLWLIRCKILAGRHDEAKSLLEREEALNSSDWRAWHLAALLAERQNDFARQIACLRHANIHIADCAKVFGEQAKFYLALGDEARAKESIKIARAVCGGDESFSAALSALEAQLDGASAAE